MDNSDDTFRAATRVVEIVKESKSKRMDTFDDKEKKNVKQIDLPNIIAFHSTEHQSFLEKIHVRAPSSFGKRIIKWSEEIFDKYNIDVETRLITDEKPKDYIEKVVEEENIDLVVLGSKGEHSKLKQIFSGTIAQKVVNDVPCDVLIVK